VAVYQLLFPSGTWPTGLRKVKIDAAWVSSSTKKKTGRITIANACMQLPINALGMGFSTKHAHDHLVGRHGDGLKLAALAFSRDGNQVSPRVDVIGGLTCTQTLLQFPHCGTISENQVDRVDRSCPRHGKPTLPRGEGCGGVDRRDTGQVRLTTMDIRGLTYPSGIISTPHGDLILDPQL
jgi:hypothetical protein